MLANQSFDAVAGILRAEDFYRRSHQQIFAVMGVLVEANQPFDIVTLAEELSRRDQLDAIGGMDYLSAIVDHTPSAANTVAYARIVREHATIRQLIHVAEEIFALRL